jgi:nicotinamide-nucleotide amidase
MPTCELITIGSELLSGKVLNTNAQYLSHQISNLNINVKHHTTCADNKNDILEALRHGMERARLVIVTGGLGSTPDDMTRQTVAQFLGCGLKGDSRQYQYIKSYFKSMGRRVLPITRSETFLPARAKPLLNTRGIALGFYVVLRSRLLVVLPGVPRELIHMFEHRVRPLIVKLIPTKIRYFYLMAKVVGLYETQIMARLTRNFFRDHDFDFGIYPELGQVTIRIKAFKHQTIQRAKRELRRLIGKNVFSYQDESLAEKIRTLLNRRKYSISCAESCTGGLLSKLLTDVPGASHFFKGSLVSYSNEAKASLLGVSQNILNKKGAVSKEVAQILSETAREKFKTSIGVSITGIAGPGGGTGKKPVGLVYIGISRPKGTRVHKFLFKGDRSKVRYQAAQRALFLTWRELKN